MFDSADDIILGAKYRDVVSESEGIAMYKVICLTGCDRVCLQTQGGEPKNLEIDVSQVEFLDAGVSERFTKEKMTAPAGAPPKVSSAFK